MKKNFILLILLGAFCWSCSESTPTHKSVMPADKDATPATVELLAKLHRMYEQGVTAVGHQDDTLYGIGWWGDEDRSDVKSVAGDYPGVSGWEIGHIELGDDYSLDSVYFPRIKRDIILTDKRGGINTVSWHLRNPMTDASAWNRDSTKGTVTAILEDDLVQAKYLKGLDRVCDFFLSLKREDGTLVPILFRPFHEHTGDWFWWGRAWCTPQEYINLWKLTQEHMASRGVHNLLFAYSPDKTDNSQMYFERFPGNDRVDMYTLDAYHRGAEAGEKEYVDNAVKTLLDLREKADKNHKVIALSETGLGGLPMVNWYTEVLNQVLDQTRPVYFLVWRSFHSFSVPYPGQASESDFLKFTQQDNILLQKDVKNI